MVVDATTAVGWGDTGSEAEVSDQLLKVVRGLQNRVTVACFASNVAGLETVIQVAEACGRRVCLLGRSMHHIVECAREAGYLTDHRPFVADAEIDYLPRNEVLLLCTGSPGAPRAPLLRGARGDRPHVGLGRARKQGSVGRRRAVKN